MIVQKYGQLKAEESETDRPFVTILQKQKKKNWITKATRETGPVMSHLSEMVCNWNIFFPLIIITFYPIVLSLRIVYKNEWDVQKKKNVFELSQLFCWYYFWCLDNNWIYDEVFRFNVTLLNVMMTANIYDFSITQIKTFLMNCCYRFYIETELFVAIWYKENGVKKLLVSF